MKKFRLSLLLLSLLLSVVGARADNVLTVHDGTVTNAYVPIYGMWCDAYLKCEFIIPADELQGMTNGTINSMTFYLSSPAAEPWGNANFQVFIREVNSTTISSFYGSDGATIVYEGPIDGTTSTMMIEFTTSYVYGGGNLLVGVYNTQPGAYKSASFFGETVNGASISGYNSGSLSNITSGTQRNFIPKTTFRYTAGEAPAVVMPTNVTASDLTYNSAQISWTDNNEKIDGWQIAYSTDANFNADETDPVDVDNNPYTLTGLTPETTYYARVRAMNEKEFSAWSNSVSFTTLQQFPKPTDLTCTGVTATTATLSWTENDNATSWEICLNDDEDNIILATSNPFTINDLPSEQIYTAKVRSIVGDNRSGWSESISFEPTAKIRIGSGTTTNSYLPTYTFYNYSLTEQIYTPEELGSAGAIQSIDFYSTATERTRKLDIYMVSTDKSSFTTTNDWVSVTSSDLVFSGEVTFATNAWTSIALTNSFIFDGKSNVLLAVDDNTGSYLSGPSFYVFSATGQAIRIYSDTNNYNPENPSGYSGTVMNVKNQIRILVGELPSCLPPSGLAIETAPTATSVGLTWTPGSDEQTVWDIAFKKDSDTDFTIIEEITEIPYTLTDLTPETTYSVKVRGNCGDEDVSAWSSELSFTTIESCVTPTELAVESTATSAIVSWEGASDSYNLRYREILLEGMAMVILNADDVWGDGTGYQMLLDANADTYGSIIPESGGLTSGGDVSASVYGEFEYKIPTNADGALTTTNMLCGSSASILIPAGTYDWCITNPTPGDRVWIASTNGNVNGRQDDYEFEAGKVYEFHVSHDVSGNDRVDVIIANVSGSGDPTATEWTDVTDATNPYEIADLTPETLYEVQVQGDCGDEQSNWNSLMFVTPTDCPVPFDIVVEPDVNTATVSWDGYSDSYNLRYRTAAGQEIFFFDDFESGSLNDWQVIRNGEGTTSTDWHVVNSNSLFSTGAIPAHSGSYVAMSRSWNQQAYSVDNWLITPEVTLDGTLKFWVKDDGQFHEYYDVYVSTTGDEIDDFELLASPGYASSTWTEVTVDLSSFMGAQGYIAIRHTDNDKDWLFIDDFGIYGDEIPVGDWTTIEDIEDTNYVIEGLEPCTDYELQVQGFCDKKETEWSDIVPFTTLFELVLLDNDLDEKDRNSDKLAEAMGKKANVTLSGRTFFKDGKWNSLLLPFEVTEEQIADENHPLHGATIKQLYSGSVTGTHVDMSFSSVSALEAGWFYIFKWENGDDIVNPVFKNVEIENNSTGLYGGYIDNDGCFYVIGNYDSFEFDPSYWGAYPYYLTSDGDLKYSDKVRVMKPFRMFFMFYANDPGALEFNLDFDDGDSTTGIVELDGNGRDNRAPEGYFNLQGVKYNGKPIQKGVYINNGHKVVVK